MYNFLKTSNLNNQITSSPQYEYGTESSPSHNADNYKLKSTTLKQKNHSNIRNQSSPYYSSNRFKFLNNTTNRQDENDYFSFRSNPPTTPISSTVQTPSIESLNSSFSNQTKQTTSSESTQPILNVSPATYASSTQSSVVTTYSSASSVSSLSSFDVKSMKSDYSSNSNSNGIQTPASSCYTDIPNSPGDPLFLQQIKSQNYSILTIDSNQSKSNDITVIEKTILANNFNSAYDYNEQDDEKVVSYDMDESLSEVKSTRSNVSCLTFKSEPAADLAFIRNLLDTKKPIQQTEFQPQVQPVMAWSANNHDNQTNPTKPTNPTFSTPPIKLNNHIDFKNDYTFVNKCLFGNNPDEDNEVDSVKVYNEDENDDCKSITSLASVPSIVKNDLENSKPDVSFDALLNRVNSNNNTINETITMANCDSLNSTKVNEQDEDDQKILFDFIEECYGNLKGDKNKEDESNEQGDETVIENENNQSEFNNDNERYLPKIIEEENEADTSISESKKLKTSSNVKINKTGPVIQMTRTAILRANKLKEMSQAKSNSNDQRKNLVQNSINKNFKFGHNLNQKK